MSKIKFITEVPDGSIFTDISGIQSTSVENVPDFKGNYLTNYQLQKLFDKGLAGTEVVNVARSISWPDLKKVARNTYAYGLADSTDLYVFKVDLRSKILSCGSPAAVLVQYHGREFYFCSNATGPNDDFSLILGKILNPTIGISKIYDIHLGKAIKDIDSVYSI